VGHDVPRRGARRSHRVHVADAGEPARIQAVAAEGLHLGLERPQLLPELAQLLGQILERVVIEIPEL
jgi:hypothetical protein